jgi:hypothetical protein
MEAWVRGSNPLSSTTSPTIDLADKVAVQSGSAEVCLGSDHERIGCLVVVGRWLRLGLVRPDIRQGTHEVIGGVLHWPWCQKFDSSELLVRGIKRLCVPALARLTSIGSRPSSEPLAQLTVALIAFAARCLSSA